MKDKRINRREFVKTTLAGFTAFEEMETDLAVLENVPSEFIA